MLAVIDSRLIPLFLVWILCIFVARKTLIHKQTLERIGLATKTHKTHKSKNMADLHRRAAPSARTGQGGKAIDAA